MSSFEERFFLRYLVWMDRFAEQTIDRWNPYYDQLRPWQRTVLCLVLSVWLRAQEWGLGRYEAAQLRRMRREC
jgi:hypothetical protein